MTLNEPPSKSPCCQLANWEPCSGTKQFPVPPDQQVAFGNVHLAGSVPPIWRSTLSRAGRLSAGNGGVSFEPGCVMMMKSVLA